MNDFFVLDISYLNFEVLERNKLLNWTTLVDSKGKIVPIFSDYYRNRKIRPEKVAICNAVSYTHLTLPTNREV